MSEPPLTPLQVERIIGYLRIFGLVAGLVLIWVTDFQNTSLRVTAWSTLVVLTGATIALWLWGGRSNWSNTATVHVGFIVDVLLIVGYAVSFAGIQPNVSFAVVFTVLADATIRYGVVGAVLGYVLGAMMLVIQAMVHESVTGEATTATGYLYVLSTLFGVAGVYALFSYLLRQRVDAQRDQALALADSLEVRERLVATTSHEVTGALTAIQLAAHTARTKRDRLPPELLDTLLGDIEGQGSHLQRLVDDLLSGEDARPGMIAIRPRLGDVSVTVSRAVDAALRHRLNHDLQVTADPVVCTLDHDRLHQIVRNLVENAFKYTGVDGSVTVSAHRQNAHIEVRVVDDGPGIPASDRARIFEPFTRSQDQAERTDSVGLGLYLVRQIVTAMGGEVELRPASVGADFSVRVPADFASDRASVN